MPLYVGFQFLVVSPIGQDHVDFAWVYLCHAYLMYLYFWYQQQNLSIIAFLF